MSASLIGSISLNISFVLYLIVYLPQIIHNRKTANIAQLSLGLHLLLLSSYLFDLCYGFSSHLPWQYKTVSIIGLSLVIIQHMQLTQFFTKNNYSRLAMMSTAFIVLSSVALYYFFIIAEGVLPAEETLMLGTAARMAGLMYCLPQIIRNKRLKAANALSLYFLGLNLTLALLDTVSAWCLDWGWPNKLASPITIAMMVIMIGQLKKYKPQPEVSSGGFLRGA